jgi:hypothetical protein
MSSRPAAPATALIVGAILLLRTGGAAAQQPAPATSSEVGSTTTAPVSADEARLWRADLAFLAQQLPARHKDAFHRTSREEFDSEVGGLDARIPRLARHEVVAGLQRIIASLHDAHTTVLLGGPGAGFHYLPLELYLFRDGLFVRAAPAEHADLVGARVVRIGGTDVEAAIDSAALYVSHENESWVRQNAPALLRLPELLHAAGITDAPDRASFVVEQEGRTRTVELRPALNQGVRHVAAENQPHRRQAPARSRRHPGRYPRGG